MLSPEHGMLSPHDGGAAAGECRTCAEHQAWASQDPLLETSDRLLSTDQVLIQLV